MECPRRRHLYAEKGRTFYTSNSGLKELKEEVSKYLDRRFGLKYEPSGEIMITVGGSEAIDGALRAMLDEGMRLSCRSQAMFRMSLV